jgi:pyruvate kinase
MDIARINCAHDSAADWVAMVDKVRRTARVGGRIKGGGALSQTRQF